MKRQTYNLPIMRDNAAYPHLEGHPRNQRPKDNAQGKGRTGKPIEIIDKQDETIKTPDGGAPQAGLDGAGMNANRQQHTEDAENSQEWEEVTHKNVHDMGGDSTERHKGESTERGDSEGVDEEYQYRDHGSGLGQHHLTLSQNVDQACLNNGSWRFVHSSKGYFRLTRVEG